MRPKMLVIQRVLIVAALAVCFSRPAEAAQFTWSYSGYITSTDFPTELPVGAPVRLEVTVDPVSQTLIQATTTVNGSSFVVAGPRVISQLGTGPGYYMYYSSGPATGPTVGSFTPWFGTFFFRSAAGPQFTDDPFSWAQSFVFTNGFGGSFGASDLTLDLPPTPAEMVSDLIDTVLVLNLQAGVSKSYCAKLSAAMGALDDSNGRNDVAAINALSAFINAVKAQTGKQLSHADAASLIAAAEQIIDALGG